jgi:DNA (cytosine-5)-methyltransferase 1
MNATSVSLLGYFCSMNSKPGLKPVRFIDLFAGMGGFREGFEKAAQKNNLEPICVYTSEIKESAIKFYSDNFEKISYEDITKKVESEIPKFDFLLAGFPCQAFSSAGKREGFLDTRGTLFFDIERIIKFHKPSGFILENVEGLVNHDKKNKDNPIGQTLEVILANLEKIGYKVTWKVLDSSDFGLAQLRRRIFIVGTLDTKISLNNFSKKFVKLKDILEAGLPLEKSKTIELLLKHYKISELPGKSLKDKRGGSNNIHSWDIELKGKTTKVQRELLNELLKARRNKKWGDQKNIVWMDGMPLTLKEIRTFFDHPKLKDMLEDLVSKGYVVYEHPKDLVEVGSGPNRKFVRQEQINLPKGYNIVAGKLSFEISKILDPNGVSPTLVATDLDRMMVIDRRGLRRLSIPEMLRLFGFSDSMIVDLKRNEIVDLLGNSVPVNMVEAVADRMLRVLINSDENQNLIDKNLNAKQELLFT